MEDAALSASRHEAIARLRKVVAAEDYAGIEVALADYRRHVDAAVAAWPPDAPPPAELAREADELMRWALLVVRSARARTRDRLEQASAVLGYCHPVPPAPTWKIDG